MVKTINKLRPKFSTHADGSDAVLFIHELVGETDGPTVGISASIHGNENAGSQAILELYRRIKDVPLKGRILLLPVANPRAFAVNHRLTPLDELNLNRVFPGDDRGNYTEQLACALSRDYFDKIDANIDLHSGTDRPTVDYVYIWSDEGLSRAFGSKILYRPTTGKTGTLYSGTTKTVTIDKRPEMKVTTIELGGGIVDQGPYVERTVQGMLNQLRYLGVLDGEVAPNPKQVVVHELVGIRPKHGGWLEPLSPANGETIKGGQLLGRVVSPYDFELIEEIPTPFENGIMVMQHLTRNLCIVGESGCGKSMTALSLLRLLPEAASVAKGEIRINGQDFLHMDQRQVEDLRGEQIAMIFQEPLTALNPVLTIGEQIAESVRQHRKVGHREALDRAIEVLQLVQMPDPKRRARQFPHELSGGMRQRAMIALALACDPRILVADEPTTALDVTIQAQILGLISDLQERLGTALILITHDLGVVAEVADRVVVMYAGRRVEEASVYDLFDHPIHPYTLGLMGAIPRPIAGRPSGERLVDITGTVPPPWDLPKGCAFAPRCPRASARCFEERPPFSEKRPGHFAACWEHVDG